MEVFQNGRFALLEISSGGKIISLQGRSERCLFISTTLLDLTKVCEISLVEKSLRVSLPLFWIKAYFQDVFKTIKGTNSSIATVEHSSSHICRRYFLMGRRLEEILMSRDKLIFQHLDFVINLKKSVLKPSEQIELLGLNIDTHAMALAVTEEKMEKVILKSLNLLSHPETTVLEIIKLIGLVSSYVQAILPPCLHLRYFQQRQQI